LFQPRPAAAVPADFEKSDCFVIGPHFLALKASISKDSTPIRLWRSLFRTCAFSKCDGVSAHRRAGKWIIIEDLSGLSLRLGTIVSLGEWDEFQDPPRAIQSTWSEPFSFAAQFVFKLVKLWYRILGR
jgi:hypothetical protein